MKHYETRVPITGQDLRVKAGQLFKMMPMYQDQREPTWSNGWLEKFQKAHGMHKTRRYGEASSVSTVDAEAEINSIREALVDVPLSNKKAWIKTEIMIEYLKWFDGQMSDRKVILIMDNFSAHKAAFEYLNSDPSTMLKNIKVNFLPPNITPLHQPPDQAAEQDKDATREMGVLKAMRWGMLSWHFDISQSTIQNCWLMSGLLSPIQGNSLTSVIEPSLSSLNNEAELVTLA
ncbi:hypothetical protein K3495_g14624 [Podosphaera aphanis]|nr:hypothetical protein K3495_g14624 [Podosphaera aphanis]